MSLTPRSESNDSLIALTSPTATSYNNIMKRVIPHFNAITKAVNMRYHSYVLLYACSIYMPRGTSSLIHKKPRSLRNHFANSSIHSINHSITMLLGVYMHILMVFGL